MQALSGCLQSLQLLASLFHNSGDKRITRWPCLPAPAHSLHSQSHTLTQAHMDLKTHCHCASAPPAVTGPFSEFVSKSKESVCLFAKLQRWALGLQKRMLKVKKNSPLLTLALHTNACKANITAGCAFLKKKKCISCVSNLWLTGNSS